MSQWKEKKWYRSISSLVIITLLMSLFGYITFQGEVESVQAYELTQYITSTATTTWFVPADWNNSSNTISIIGGGGGGYTGTGGGGGGGAFSRSTNVTLTPGSSVGIAIGSGGSAGSAGGDSWICTSTSNCATINGSAVVVGAKGGGGGTNTAGGTGGAAGSGFGSDKCSGGTGGPDDAAGGGGAGGPTGDSTCGNGGNGGDGLDSAGYFTGGGGGGGGGGSAGANAPDGANGGNGGNNYLGSGGGSGASKVGDDGTSGGGGGGGGGAIAGGGNGGAGTEFGSYGSGGGGAGGANDQTGGNGGNYGGGGGSGSTGGSGAQGIIVITYAPLDLTPPSPSTMTFATAPDDASISSIDMVATTATDASSTPITYFFTAVTGSCGSNLGTGGTDSGWQSSTSYTDTGLQTNKCYGYTVTAKDDSDNTNSTSSASSAYTTAATPGAISFSNVASSSFTISNAENGNPSSNPTTEFAVQVSATSPTDSTWDTKYVDSSGDPSDTAVWLTDAQIDNLSVTGLTSLTQYTLRVKARNGDNDETAWSSTNNTTTLSPDSEPPAPDPMTFATAPDGLSISSVDMIATTATDDSAVQYFFKVVTGSCSSDLGTGGTDSGWQSSTSYTDTGLQTNKCYGYTVTARDVYDNYGATSTASSTYTEAATPGAPVITNTSTSTISFTNTENGNPSSNPTTEFAMQVSATSPIDATWDGKYVDENGDPSDTAVWLSDSILDALDIVGLNGTTIYTIRAKARNEDGDETPFGATSQTETLLQPKTNYIRLQGGSVIQPGSENIILQ